ncbi:transaldolase [Candidatus Uabimicrobium amorphum]|uniref:Transaldolase n=1 Tax=Uabimicrobium amorphum TaxID=2596890 RepID=A0A5S9IK68_UABAM|nr:transaldolase [Candidatus Uabimicrobium amorphum]BBM83214.1 glucose-6-phosphate isomerase [Candidatus Uabimicrobium amorphum]
MANPLLQVQNYSQSIWYDNIQRSLLSKIKQMIDEGEIVGITSNPTIFDKAIGGSNDYDDMMTELLENNPQMSIKELYEALVIEDIREAADLLRGVYDATSGVDGYVSVEVSPDLAHDTEGTIKEAQHLFRTIDRENVMIKVPATKEGLPAITQIIGQGINVNVTLMFAMQDFLDVADAYLSGLELLDKNGGKLDGVASVASFFISRMDSAVDKLLPENSAIAGKVAISYAKNVYQKAIEFYASQRFKDLEAKGARIQRLLWASTGVKNPAYRDVLYMEELMGENTVNTVPPHTLDAFRDHGNAASRVGKNLEEVQEVLAKVQELNIDLQQIASKLKEDGVAAFSKSFASLMQTLEEKKAKLGEKKNLAAKLLEKDCSLWDFPGVNLDEVRERLGWLDSVRETQQKISDLQEFAHEVREKFSAVVLLGMGGSSLAPEVFMKIFGNKSGYPSLRVIDTTNPVTIRQYLQEMDLAKTVFVVSSKSGGTIETLSLYKFFFAEVQKVSSQPGQHFIAITDPGSKLENIANEKQFLRTFFAPQDVGGRYSVFTVFGMVPAALIGAPLQNILDSAEKIQNSLSATDEISPVVLGTTLGKLATQGKNKLTFVLSDQLTPFADWVEQLVAESTGKIGKGVLPVAGEHLQENYSNDRVFVCVTVGEEKAPNIPSDNVLHIHLENLTDLGGEFLRWQVATAICGSVLQINPFDQPDVELAKIKARELMSGDGSVTSGDVKIVRDDLEIYSANIDEGTNIEGLLCSLLSSIKSSDYFAVMAYLPYDEEITNILQKIRCHIQQKHNIATTIGFGPRFLHSTGQLHKGDDNSGVFLQITHSAQDKLAVPGENYDFNTLIHAQAAGDFQALKEKKRRVLRYHINGKLLVALKNLLFTMENDV